MKAQQGQHVGRAQQVAGRDVHREEHDGGDRRGGHQGDQGARVRQQGRQHQVQAREQDEEVDRRGRGLPAHQELVEDDIDGREHGQQPERIHEEAVAVVEGRRLVIERHQEEEHALEQVLERQGHDVEPDLGLRVLDLVLLTAPRAEQAEEQHQHQPAEAEQHDHPAGVVVALAGVHHHEGAEGQRVRRVQPPQLAAVPGHERPHLREALERREVLLGDALRQASRGRRRRARVRVRAREVGGGLPQVGAERGDEGRAGRARDGARRRDVLGGRPGRRVGDGHGSVRGWWRWWSRWWSRRWSRCRSRCRSRRWSRRWSRRPMKRRSRWWSSKRRYRRRLRRSRRRARR
jgi:hypothetical protein